MEATDGPQVDGEKKSPIFEKFVGYENTQQKDCPAPREDEYKEVAWAIPRYGEKF